MSIQRRRFSTKFKSDLVIKLFKGEKDVNTLTTGNNIQPNLLRNWKKEFLNNDSALFGDKCKGNIKGKFWVESQEKAQYTKRLLSYLFRLIVSKYPKKFVPDYESKHNLKLFND